MTDLLARIEKQGDPVGGLDIWFLGGPSVALKTPRTLVYLDLFTGRPDVSHVHKAIPEVLDPRAIRRADLVLSTHDHLDHCHQDSLVPIYHHTTALFLGSESCYGHYREWGFAPGRCLAVVPGSRLAFKDLELVGFVSHDWADGSAVAFLLRMPELTLFDGGDSLYGPVFREVGRTEPVDVALLNFARNPGRERIFMDAREIAQAACDLGARIVIPKHWDLWVEYREDPGEITSALRETGIEVVIPRLGHCYRISGPERIGEWLTD